MGSGGGSVGRAVASETRDPQFEPSHWRILKNVFIECELYWKDENKEKEAGKGPLQKQGNTVSPLNVLSKSFKLLDTMNYDVAFKCH